MAIMEDTTSSFEIDSSSTCSTSPLTEICVRKSTIGTYEASQIWRKQYIDWLDDTKLYGSFRVMLTRRSRTWHLDVFFSDVRDAVLFKLKM